LKQKGASQLNDAQLKSFIVGKAMWMQNNVTGEQFSVNFTPEGNSIMFRTGFNTVVPSGWGKVALDGYEGITSRYAIADGKLVTYISQEAYSIAIYKLGDTYYAARSNEFGYANYEMIAAPQIAVNPITEVSNQFALELGLTEQQRQQILPILGDEIKALGALKKDTTLSGLKKVEKIREIGVSFDDKLKPLLNADQHKKFEDLRAAFRRRMVETMASQAMQKAEAAVKYPQWFTSKSNK